MAYNLPPPWDPGYALPDNVRDEGLERKAYVTKWMVRGTYDAPRVGSGGYVLPPNVQAEGYGQGTYTTKWLPRGYYDGRVPHYLNRRPAVIADRRIGPRMRAVTYAPPVAVQPFDQGQAVAVSGTDDLHPVFTNYGERAANILLSAVSGLPQQQAKAKLKMLMDRIDPTLWGRTAELTRRYMAQGLAGIAALRAGLAMAMGSGIAAEIIRTGLSRRAPQARSLLGLGCYGCAAALGADVATFSNAQNVSTLISAQIASGQQATFAQPARLQIGPWQLPATPGQAVTIPVAQLTSAQKSTLSNGWAKAAAAYMAIHTSTVPGQIDGGWSDLSTVGLGSGKIPANVINGSTPTFKFTNPNDGKLATITVRSAGTAAVPAISLVWNYYTGAITTLIKALVELAAAVIKDVIAPILGEVGNLACDLLGNPVITLAAAGAAASAGAPPQAGATGASIAQQACGKAPPPAIPVSSDSSIMLPVAIIGGAALLAVLLSSKKKAPTP